MLTIFWDHRHSWFRFAKKWKKILKMRLRMPIGERLTYTRQGRWRRRLHTDLIPTAIATLQFLMLSLLSRSCSLDFLRRCRAPHLHHPLRLSQTKNLTSSSTSRYQLLQRISRCYIGTISSCSCSSMSAVAASKHSSSVFVFV
jgi:hypothetical protein